MYYALRIFKITRLREALQDDLKMTALHGELRFYLFEFQTNAHASVRLGALSP
jgi:hypothetical protein